MGERVKKAKHGEWILGRGWNQNVWGTWPLASELDAIAPNNPVYLTAKSLHAGWANTTALKLANITSQTPHPHNGQIQHDAKGNTPGISETAMELEREQFPNPRLMIWHGARKKLNPFYGGWVSLCIHDLTAALIYGIKKLRAQNKLKLRVLKNNPR